MVNWEEPTSVSSKSVVGHRIYYKEFGVEGILGKQDVGLQETSVTIYGESITH